MNELHISYASTPRIQANSYAVVRTVSLLLLIATFVASIVYIDVNRRKALIREQ